MRGCLVQVSPLDPATGSRVTYRCGQALNSRTLEADGQTWATAITAAPKITFDFFDVDYKGTVQFGRAALTLNTKRLMGVDRNYLTTLIWDGAPISIWSGDGAATADMTLEFTGLVSTGVIDRSTGILPLSCEVNRRLIDVPLLNIEYGGGGGADGDPEVRGQLKPACFGNPVNVPVFFFDQVNWIGQVDGYGNVTAINTLYENAASFGAKQADYATYAALLAAAIPEGKWATCVAQGMIRLGAEPKGVITADPVAGAGTPGTMMQRWLTAHAGVTGGNIDAASFAALDAALAALLGHAAAVSYFTQSQGNVLDRCQAMLAACNATMFYAPSGQITASRAINPGAAAMTLNRIGGQAPQVMDWRSLDTPEPWWRLKAEAAKTWRVHNLNEIDYEDDIVLRGNYDPAETYRQGHVVYQPTDGVRYLFINAAPSAGHAPPNAVYWDVYEDAADATVTTYADGTPLEALKPAQAGADITGTHTASAITGQGALATQGNVYFTSPYIKESIGGADATLANFKTAVGTAAAIAGQGSLATRNDILASMLQINDVVNLYQDPEFVDAAYQVLTSGWVTTTEALVTNSTLAGGLAAVRGIKTVVGNGTLTQGQTASDTAAASRPRVEPGQRYRLVVWAAWIAGFSGKLDCSIRWFDRAGGTITDSALPVADFRTVAAAANGTFTALLDVTAPATSYSAHLRYSVIWSTTIASAGYGIYARPRFSRLPKTGSAGDLVGEDNALLTDIVIKTSLGTASAIANQGLLATRNIARLSAEIYRANGTTLIDDADAITSLGTSAAIAGQGAWATYGTISPTTMEGRTQYLNSAGRINTYTGMQANRSYGLRSVFDPPIFSDTYVGAGNITINIGASTLTTDTGGSISLPSGSLTGRAEGTKYFIYRTMADPASSSGTYGASTTLPGAISTTAIYLGFWTTRVGSGGAGGGGTYGGNDCVVEDAFVAHTKGPRLASKIVAGDCLAVLNEDTMQGLAWATVKHAGFGMADCVRLLTTSGKRLSLAVNTPITQPDGRPVIAGQSMNGQVPVSDSSGFRWERIVEVEAIGTRRVRQLDLGGRTFGAGDSPGAMLYTHNIYQKP